MRRDRAFLEGVLMVREVLLVKVDLLRRSLDGRWLGRERPLTKAMALLGGRR